MAKRVIHSARDDVMGEISGKFGKISEIPSNFSLHTRNFMVEIVYIDYKIFCTITKGRGCELAHLGTVETVHSLLGALPQKVSEYQIILCEKLVLTSQCRWLNSEFGQ